jgi:DNA-binding transcriptional LysR family regulator
MIAPLLAEFLARHGHVQIDLILSDEVADLVTERTDVAIRVGELPDSGMTARKLFENRPVVVAAPSYLARSGKPQTPGDLARHACLDFTFRRAVAGWPFLIEGERVVVDVTGHLRANNGETVRQLAVEGLGVARLGRFLVEEDIAAGRLTPVLEGFDAGDREPINALYIGGPNTPRRVRVFVEFLKEKIAERSRE